MPQRHVSGNTSGRSETIDVTYLFFVLLCSFKHEPWSHKEKKKKYT